MLVTMNVLMLVVVALVPVIADGQARGLEGPYDPANPFARILRGEAACTCT